MIGRPESEAGAIIDRLWNSFRMRATATRPRRCWPIVASSAGDSTRSALGNGRKACLLKCNSKDRNPATTSVQIAAAPSLRKAPELPNSA
jgi:hypothetical protein